MSSSNVKHISECYIRPNREIHYSKKSFYLTPMDLSLLSTHYIEIGLLFSKSSNSSNYDRHEYSTNDFIQRLKDSLSSTLVHFYPLAGQLVTQVNEIMSQSCIVFVDCNKGPGARFVHASLDVTIDDILSPIDVPTVVDLIFDHHGAVNHDGHTQPLLSIQVTELVDGVFIGCSMNHSIVDGASYWHFWNVWSALHLGANSDHVQLPVCDGYREAIALPYTHPDQFIGRFELTSQDIRKRMFHFSHEAIANIKAKANEGSGSSEISSLQALCALVWRSIARANNDPQGHQVTTTFVLAANNRTRLNPQLPKQYFGNYITGMKTSTTESELLAHDFGWAGSLLHQIVVNYNDKAIRDYEEKWIRSPRINQLGPMLKANIILLSHSPRFDVYGNEFGLGRPIARRSGHATRFVGSVSVFPGYEGGGSIELEICLPADTMDALQSDEEFFLLGQNRD